MDDDYEECIGCGWAFADGGKKIGVDVRNSDGEERILPICEPCEHASHSWVQGRSLDATRMFISQCTNLILSKIEKLSREEPPKP